MDTKEKVLKILYSHGGGISGEEIAKHLGLSRNSVWKAIEQLRAKGYIIDATKAGYTLKSFDAFDEVSIKRYLKREHKLHIYKKESSSNILAKELCRAGAAEGDIVIVESQTSGKGRLGRTFISNSENGLYMTIVLRPKITAAESVGITVLGAVSVVEAIEKLTTKPCTIKWVNDVYMGEKKCCGILTEASLDFESGCLQYAVIGIGINLCEPKGGFDEEIKEIACGIYEGEQCPSGFKARLCAQIINCFFDRYEDFENKEYINVYRQKSNIIGKEVDVHVGDAVLSGTAVYIDDNANLIVEDNAGKCHIFNSGEARVRKASK